MRASYNPGLRTRFALDLPRGHDVQLGLTFGDATKPCSERENRVLIFVNGWNMGNSSPTSARNALS